jgi:hypothetical protein
VLADHYTKTEADVLLAAKLNANNPSYTGTLTGGTGVINIGSGQLYKDASGNVGIGTSSPASDAQLTLAADNAPAIMLRRTGAFRFDSAIGMPSGGDLAFYTGADSSTISGLTERMRINSSGNLSIGGSSSFGFRFAAISPSGTGTGVFYQTTTTTTDNVIIVASDVGSSGANRLVILASGNVQNVNNSYGALSDAKLKENIVDASPKLDKLNQVRVVNYNLKSDPEQKLLGVVAQELEQIFPGMVEETPDRDKEGNDFGTTTKSVKYSVFVPMLIKAMQEQQAMIASQSEIIDSLKASVEALDARLTSLEGAQE